MYITHHILVEEIEDHVSQPRVAPMTVYQNELSQELKSRDGKVTGHHRLYEGRRHHKHCKSGGKDLFC